MGLHTHFGSLFGHTMSDSASDKECISQWNWLVDDICSSMLSPNTCTLT